MRKKEWRRKRWEGEREGEEQTTPLTFLRF